MIHLICILLRYTHGCVSEYFCSGMIHIRGCTLLRWSFLLILHTCTEDKERTLPVRSVSTSQHLTDSWMLSVQFSCEWWQILSETRQENHFLWLDPHLQFSRQRHNEKTEGRTSLRSFPNECPPNHMHSRSLYKATTHTNTKIQNRVALPRRTKYFFVSTI